MKTLYFSTYEHFKNDTHLFRDTNLIAGLIFTSAILENMLLFCLQSQSKSECSFCHILCN